MLCIEMFKRKRINELKLWFENRDEFLNSLKLLENHVPDRLTRHAAILINPIAGKRRSRRYWDRILKPILDYCKIKYQVFVTTSETYVQEWVEKIEFDTFEFTEIVLIGGDGLFSQYLNAVSAHLDADKLLKIPIALMPGGSMNAI